jgi:hypothetical protein
MRRKTQAILVAFYILATVQFVWCYLWLTRPYVNTSSYEQGLERMPFQGRILMAVPMKWAHHSTALHDLSQSFAKSQFWFPKPVQPEVLVQAIIDVSCLLCAGYLTTKIYQASSGHRLLTPFVYPLLLVVCGATYIMHTVQNFRFIYDLPSLAFFALGMYLIYFKKHWMCFAAFFLFATINRETTLLLLPLYMLDRESDKGSLRWSSLLRSNSLVVVLPLAVLWAGWQLFVRHVFAANMSEFYPRVDWNLKSIVVPQAWPQLLSACAYLPIFIVLMRRRIVDRQLRIWLWILPCWIAFMFVFGILIETRVYGELIPYVVCVTILIIEETLISRLKDQTAPQAHTLDRTSVEIGQAA